MRLTTLSCLLFASSLAAQPSDFQTFLPYGSQIGLVVLDPQGTPLVEHNADTLLQPASTIKLLTATSALLALGLDFRYETKIVQQSHQGQTNVSLSLSGDPTLTSADLFNLFNQLKANGTSEISGDFLIDGSVFSGHDKASGWPWDDLAICYSAPASAYVLDHGCLYARLNITEQKVTLEKAQHRPISVENQVTFGESSDFCPLLLNDFGQNNYQLTGCVDRTRALAISITDPKAYLLATVQQQLQETGITVKGAIRFGKAQGELLVKHRSASLETLLKRVLHNSDNQISDSLLRTVGHRKFRHGSFALGIRASVEMLKKYGVDFSQASLHDGSGLSRYNLITPRQLAQLLHLWQTEPQLAILTKLLPTAGKEGTMAYRRGTQVVNGALQAKTGTFSQVANLAGIFKASDNEDWTVVQMVNGLNAPRAERKQKLNEFESVWYQCLKNRCLPELQYSARSE